MRSFIVNRRTGTWMHDYRWAACSIASVTMPRQSLSSRKTWSDTLRAAGRSLACSGHSRPKVRDWRRMAFTNSTKPRGRRLTRCSALRISNGQNNRLGLLEYTGLGSRAARPYDGTVPRPPLQVEFTVSSTLVLADYFILTCTL